MSLVKHAEREMKLAGLDKEDSAYGGMIYNAVMKLIETHAAEGHSGGSHVTTMGVFERVANFKTLTPLTADPSEWMEVGNDKRGTCFQSLRQSTCFSYDGGKTFYDLEDPEQKNWPEDMKGTSES